MNNKWDSFETKNSIDQENINVEVVENKNSYNIGNEKFNDINIRSSNTTIPPEETKIQVDGGISQDNKNLPPDDKPGEEAKPGEEEERPSSYETLDESVCDTLVTILSLIIIYYIIEKRFNENSS
jgi:hypothetical protein